MKFLLLSLVFTPFLALANGGQNQEGNPIFEDDCVTITPPGINPDTCVETPAPPQSGIQVFFCEDQVVVLCPPEDD